MLRKTMVIAMIIMLAMGSLLFAGGSPEKGAMVKKPKIAVVTDLGGLGDQAYNDAGHAGLKRAQADFDIETRIVESSAVAEYETNLQSVAQLGFDLVFGLGAGLSDAAKSVAQRYPNTMFVLIDGNVSDVPNILSVNYKEEQSAFLAGALAAKMTKTGKIGFVLGMKIPVLERFEVGYLAGAHYTNPKVDTLTVYTGKFNDPGLGKESAITLYGQNVDIVAAAAGACNLGVFDAATERGANAWAMGAAAGQSHLAPNDIMADQVKRLDNTIYNIVKTYLDEGTIQGGLTVFGLAEGGVGMLYGKNPAGISQEVFDYIDSLTEKIIEGSIVVPRTHAELAAFRK